MIEADIDKLFEEEKNRFKLHLDNMYEPPDVMDYYFRVTEKLSCKVIEQIEDYQLSNPYIFYELLGVMDRLEIDAHGAERTFSLIDRKLSERDDRLGNTHSMFHIELERAATRYFEVKIKNKLIRRIRLKN